MKANEILKWVVDNSISGEFLGIVDVPNEPWQNEEWWIDYFGNCPPSPISAGKYLYAYESQVSEIIDLDETTQIEMPLEHGGFDYIYLIKIDD